MLERGLGSDCALFQSDEVERNACQKIEERSLSESMPGTHEWTRWPCWWCD